MQNCAMKGVPTTAFWDTLMYYLNYTTLFENNIHGFMVHGSTIEGKCCP